MRNINNILHFSATNIDFSAKYKSDSRFLASSQLSGDGVTYKTDSNVSQFLARPHNHFLLYMVYHKEVV